MKALGVFCGSSRGTQPSFTAASAELGSALAARGIELIYGGASIGLMGVVADAALAGGGRATGIITQALAGHEIAHSTLSELEVVNTMHERKARMAELADAFLMLPGGFGTYEEFMEVATWGQLGIHDKPCAILNVDGFFDDLLSFLGHAVEVGFIKAARLGDIAVHTEVTSVLEVLSRGTRV